jgi:hypothetical protein
LSVNKIGDTEANAIGKMSHLRELWLNSTSLSDNGVKSLSGLEKLEVLDLGDTNVSDASVAIVGKMQTLRKLNVSETRMTEKGVQQLRQLIPKCRVIGESVQKQQQCKQLGPTEKSL